MIFLLFALKMVFTFLKQLAAILKLVDNILLTQDKTATDLEIDKVTMYRLYRIKGILDECSNIAFRVKTLWYTDYELAKSLMRGARELYLEAASELRK